MAENLEESQVNNLDTRQKNRYVNISDSLYTNFDYLKKLFESENHHNAENGSYNETLLIELFEKELSSNFKATSGFVINKQGKISTQFDLIIYESTTPLVFDKGRISIVPLEGVRAIIEIKTSVAGLDTSSSDSLKKIIHKLVIQNREIHGENKDIIFGVFGYKLGVEMNESQLENIFNKQEYLDVNFCISLNKNIFINSFDRENTLVREYRHKLFKFNKDWSTGYFLDNIRYKVNQYDKYYLDYLFPTRGKDPYFIRNLN
ncbi:DUF6602 domain-containing protein [Vagococcus fluvialis]|uniref:DUF6602 domain-containing protein n=1 Tax=Vagococcus fluvialis TaxID=2738 RepID=UPI0032E3D90D